MKGWLLLAACSSLAAFPGALLTAAYTFYAVEESPSWLALSAVVVLPSFFAAFSKLWGFLADRFGARKLFILLGWFSSAFALIPPLFEPRFETVFISGVVGSALWSVGAPALTAEVMRVKKQGTRLGVGRSLSNAVYLAGVACAGALYDVIGIRGVLAGCLAIYMVAGSAVAIAYKPDRGGSAR